MHAYVKVLTDIQSIKIIADVAPVHCKISQAASRGARSKPSLPIALYRTELLYMWL
jgi:hypothetical protein